MNETRPMPRGRFETAHSNVKRVSVRPKPVCRAVLHELTATSAAHYRIPYRCLTPCAARLTIVPMECGRQSTRCRRRRRPHRMTNSDRRNSPIGRSWLLSLTVPDPKWVDCPSVERDLMGAAPGETASQAGAMPSGQHNSHNARQCHPQLHRSVLGPVSRPPLYAQPRDRGPGCLAQRYR